VLVAGDPGIGKSRLIAAVEVRLSREKHTRVRCFCSPHHQDSALYPIISQLEYAAGFDSRDPPDEKARKLRSFIAPTSPSGEDVALLADLLSLTADRLPALALSPQRKKEKTFETLLRQFEGLTQGRPVLVLFEDVHWADPSTIEFLDVIIDGIRSLPALLVITHRPEFRAPWAGRAHVSTVTLRRLDRQESVLAVQVRSGSVTLPDRLVSQIVEGSDGLPLFIEELTKAVLDSTAASGLEEPGRFVPAPIPSTLQASVMARLDRLPAAKEIAQIAAVIGREFSCPLMSAAALMPEQAVRRGLDQLVTSELVLRRGVPPDDTYTFKHALVQDAVYETLLRSRRNKLHARVVQALRENVPELETTQPGLLGHHCAQAGLIEQAASYYRRAGERSAERAAMTETHSQLERGLALTGTLPDSPARRMLEAELKLALGRVRLSTKGNADVEAGRIFEEATDLCRGLGRVELLTRAIWGYWFNKAHRTELIGAENAVQELLRLGPESEPECDPAVAHAMLGITRFWQARFPEARVNLQTALELWRADETNKLDLAIVSDHLDHHIRMQHSLTLTCLGYLTQAAAEARLATRQALGLAHLPTQAIVIAARCRHDYFIRDDGSLRKMATCLVSLAEEQGLPFYLALGRCHLGWLAVKEGRIDQGLNLLQTSVEGLQATDAIIWQPFVRGVIAEAQSCAGNIATAEQLLDEAIARSAQTGGVWFSAELHRHKGEILLMRASPAPQAAEQYFQQALTIARNQSAKLWELKAATSLARLWLRHGNHTEARALLTPIHAWFAEGIEIPDVHDAAKLLDQLASRR
jgi:predicted ATPase